MYKKYNKNIFLGGYMHFKNDLLLWRDEMTLAAEQSLTENISCVFS